MRVDVSTCTIGKFLDGPYYQPPINTKEMDNHLEEMRKITRIQLGSEENMGFFRWITTQIESNDENIVWVVGGPGVTS